MRFRQKNPKLKFIENHTLYILEFFHQLLSDPVTLAPFKPSDRFPLSFLGGVLTPLLAFALFTPISADLDLKVSAFFYEKGAFSSWPFWSWVYTYALLPGWILALCALIFFLASFRKNCAVWRKPSLYLLLCLAIGSGLIIHGILKEHWGRARPRQVIEFGGNQPFRPYFTPHFTATSESTKSFACGHASLGFYFFSLAFLGAIYKKRAVYRLSMILALLLGSLLSIARIAQGGHFLSDTLASALIMWLTAWVLAYFLFKKECKSAVL